MYDQEEENWDEEIDNSSNRTNVSNDHAGRGRDHSNSTQSYGGFHQPKSNYTNRSNGQDPNERRHSNNTQSYGNFHQQNSNYAGRHNDDHHNNSTQNYGGFQHKSSYVSSNHSRDHQSQNSRGDFYNQSGSDSKSNQFGRNDSNQNDRFASFRSRPNDSQMSRESNSFELRIPKNTVGMVIGKGGSKIRELQETSGAHINIEKGGAGDYNDTQTSVMISGDDDCIQHAKDLINSLISERDSDSQTGFQRQRRNEASNYGDEVIGRGAHNNGTNSENDSQMYRESNSFELRIPKNTVGMVIGKGGSKIRELQETSGAHINIEKSGAGDYNDTQTLVTISGDNDCIQHAKDLINSLISERDSDSQTGSQRQRRNETSNYGDEVEDKSGAHIKVTNDSNADDEIIVKIRGDSNQIKEAKSLIDEIINPYSFKYPTNEDSDFQPVDWSKLKVESELQRAKWLESLPQISKDFYIEDPDVANMEESEVEYFKMENNKIVANNVDPDIDREIPNPVENFQQAFKHYPEILEQIQLQGFEKPSPIQCQAWPVVLQGIDLIGIAQTERSGPTAVILAPTRELAQQIEREAKKYEYRGIRSVCIYGGGSRREQIKIIEKGVEIVIATPGRLGDLVMNRVIDLSCVTFLVLDEADRMLDMGFEPQINKILIDIRPDRQTVMTSATWPEEVRRLGSKYTVNPIIVFIGTLDLAACHSVSQTIEMIDETKKRERAIEFIDNMEEDHKVIIFVGKKAIADDMTSDLVLQGIACDSIHGDRLDREQALEDFKSGHVKILIATDVASRGLDISDITHIFNYDFPRNVEEYVHRIGRTGRAGRSGESITLVTREDWRQAEELIKIMVEAEQEVPEELHEMAQRYAAHKEKQDLRGGPRRGGGRGRGRGNSRGSRW
ncbi:putative ATP-dependent RNA helicase DDX43 [Nymphon striatum]|nr:putative ATP-dependent RNA helicase DDX43 [Nymphon striatum]